MASSGMGTTFGKQDGTTGTFTSLAEIKDITGPSMSRETLDTTAIDTAGGYRTFITGVKDAGAITLSLNYTAVAYSTMLAGFTSDVAATYQIKLPDGTTLVFDGLVTEIPLTIPTGLVTFTVTVKISGAVTVTFPSGTASSSV